MVIKMVSASSGRGVTIEETDRQNPDRQFSEIISRGRCSIEERIHQAEELNVFNESSVNTVRIMTFYTRHGIVIGPCFFRTGKAGSYVDNGGSGGILVGVDRTTGVLNSDGYDEFPRVFPVHPDSGVPFRGFSLPDWPRCVALVKEMAALLPKVGYIGWDLALSADYGWVVVEANGGSHIMTQFVYDEGCRKEIDGYMADMRIYGR